MNKDINNLVKENSVQMKIVNLEENVESSSSGSIEASPWELIGFYSRNEDSSGYIFLENQSVQIKEQSLEREEPVVVPEEI